MSLKNFWRKEDPRISSVSPELKNHITNWTKKYGWNFEDFATFLELIGIPMPVQLRAFNYISGEFWCDFEQKTKCALISLRFAEPFERNPEIYVKIGNETKIFSINWSPKGEKRKPKVTFVGRQIQDGPRELTCDYRYNRTRELRIKESADHFYVLHIYMSEPESFLIAGEENTIFRNAEKVEEYLMKLDYSLRLVDVYKTLVTLSGLSSKDIESCREILITYTETVGRTEKMVGKILICRGALKEYAITKAGETFTIWNDGTWKYSSEKAEISYSARRQSCNLKATGTEEDISNLDLKKLLPHVKGEISKLQSSHPFSKK